MTVVISQKIREKLLSKHHVSEDEVAQCFANCDGTFLKDPREAHASDPPTLWFVSETDHGKKLKIAFILKEGKNYIRTAYPPNADEIRIYKKYAGQS